MHDTLHFDATLLHQSSVDAFVLCILFTVEEFLPQFVFGVLFMIETEFGSCKIALELM